MFWAAALSGGGLGYDTEIGTFWSFGHNVLPPVRGFAAGGEEAEMKSQCWGSCTPCSWEQGSVCGGFPPRERGDREFFAGLQAINAIYIKSRFSALPLFACAKWVSGWGGHLVSPILDFSGVLLGDQAPHFWRSSCASLVFACLSPEAQS